MLSVLRVLVDADNVAPARLQPLLDLLVAHGAPMRLTASGSQRAIDALAWPENSELLVHAGWQAADAALAQAYSPADEPLILVSGDGDFGLLAARHPGAVLVVSGAPNRRLRDTAMIVDPAAEGVGPIRDWLLARAAEQR